MGNFQKVENFVILKKAIISHHFVGRKHFDKGNEGNDIKKTEVNINFEK